MVRAILEGRKSQTRRVVKDFDPKGSWAEGGGEIDFCSLTDIERIAVEPIKATKYWRRIVCPYGQPGDRLWVKEAYYAWGKWIHNGKTKSGRQAWKFVQVGTSIRYMDGNKPSKTAKRDGECGWVYRHGRFMPKKHSRQTIEITDVRVQRLQEISEEDAAAEGASPWEFGPEQALTSGERGAVLPYRGGFACLWDEINADRATWYSNPWVWAITFKRIEAAERAA
jgi:hypothetical protein